MFFISGKTYLYFQLNNIFRDIEHLLKMLKIFFNWKFQCTNPDKQAKPSDKNVQNALKLKSAYVSYLTGDQSASW